MKKNIQYITILASILCLSCSRTTETPAAKGSSPSYIAVQYDIDYSDAFDYLNEYLDSFVNDGYLLPDIFNDEPIRWAVSSGNAEIRENRIYKTEIASEYEPIVLQAQVADQLYLFDNILLLDPYVAYVMSYFTPEGNDSEQLKLAYSYDSLYWFKFGNDTGILKPNVGTQRLRDPSIVRNKNGSFTLLATQGYNTDSVYVYSSADLVNYDNEHLLQLNYSTENLNLSEKQSWAPEGFYDRTINQYVIYWSSVEDHGMYYNLSDDFETFSYPEKLLDTGYDVIDGTICKNGIEYTIILKDERQPMENYSQLIRGTSSGNWSSFDTFSSPIYSRHQTEGPMIMKALEKQGWYVYCDDYTRSQYKVLYTTDINQGTFKEINDNQLMIPMEDAAHGSAIPVTWKELERIMAVYGD